jgi:hypothetical protein
MNDLPAAFLLLMIIGIYLPALRDGVWNKRSFLLNANGFARSETLWGEADEPAAVDLPHRSRSRIQAGSIPRRATTRTICGAHPSWAAPPEP